MACIVFPENLVGYRPNTPDHESEPRFQWPVQEGDVYDELIDYMTSKQTTFEDCLLVVNRTAPIEGYLKFIQGALYFQLKMTAEDAVRRIPLVTEEVRQAALSRVPAMPAAKAPTDPSPTT